MEDLKVCTNLSASPFELGWYGAISVCCMPLLRQNSTATNWGPLSLTMWSGKPYLENNDLWTLIVFSAVVDVITITSGHFEQALMTMSHICPSKGPAKSM